MRGVLRLLGEGGDTQRGGLLVQGILGPLELFLDVLVGFHFMAVSLLLGCTVFMLA
jgi:hypothetical protein